MRCFSLVPLAAVAGFKPDAASGQGSRGISSHPDPGPPILPGCRIKVEIAATVNEEEISKCTVAIF
jgi:hypothetical protein